MINESHSSTRKGESLEDTIRTLDMYGDAIVLRHPDNDSADIAAKYADHPVINAGNDPVSTLLRLSSISSPSGKSSARSMVSPSHSPATSVMAVQCTACARS